MASIASHQSAIETKHELTPGAALRYAWIGYLILLTCPFLMFLYVASSLNDGLPTGNRPLVDGWFIASVAYMVLAAPASFFIRSRFFRDYWKGKCVRPRSYLTGMFIVWGTLEIGGLLSLTGCLLSRSLLPTLLPALAAFMMFVMLWPSGRAMINLHGGSDDPEKYGEPR
jgi:hypothetical protein